MSGILGHNPDECRPRLCHLNGSFQLENPQLKNKNCSKQGQGIDLTPSH